MNNYLYYLALGISVSSILIGIDSLDNSFSLFNLGVSWTISSLLISSILYLANKLNTNQ